MPPRERRRRGELRLALALWLGILSTLVPLTRVVQSGPWLWGAIALPFALLALGYSLRRLRLPVIVVTIVELAAWTGAVTAVFFPANALLGVIPTGGVVEALPRMITAASALIADGAAPLAPTQPLVFLIVASLGLLTIALDHVVVTARMPLLASIALVAVWLIPAIAVPAGVDIVAFVLLAASVLLLIRAETRTREARTSGASARTVNAGGVTAVATAIGAVAIIAALAVGPTLEASLPAAGFGTSTMIDPSLDLGKDLRRQDNATVLTLRTDGTRVPYLRVATLSLFDGTVWRPDRTSTVDLSAAPLEPVDVSPDIALTPTRTTVTIKNLASAYAPVPYPATEVDGLAGAWQFAPYNRTVAGAAGATQGQEYTVVSDIAQPTLEQIRASSAGGAGVSIDVDSLPAGSPPIIAQLARQVTAQADTDYDKLIALQDWFRGPEFTYSLDAPVQEGFDGQGVDAVAAFLQAKTGYCVHFAGAFALMARSLGMPTRIVVGFLPGSFTGQVIDGQRVIDVTGRQLHAWPEVSFRGIGWVPFEPTKSLGTETRFDSAASTATAAPTTSPRPEATSAATTAPTADVNDPQQGAQTDAAGSGPTLMDLRPLLTVLGGIVVLAALPGLTGAVRRLMLRRRATVAAAWRLVQDTAIDAGLPVPSSRSPRAFGAFLVAAGSAPAEEMSRLVAAVERANYAADAASGGPDAAAMSAALGIRSAMLAAMPAARRARMLALPWSLVVRPGSGFADRGAPV